MPGSVYADTAPGQVRDPELRDGYDKRERTIAQNGVLTLTNQGRKNFAGLSLSNGLCMNPVPAPDQRSIFRQCCISVSSVLARICMMIPIGHLRSFPCTRVVGALEMEGIITT